VAEEIGSLDAEALADCIQVVDSCTCSRSDQIAASA
jgi:hypothetical protein